MLKQAGFLLGIITNGSGHQMTNIRAINIEHYFDVILISEWEGVKKPEPEIFHRALGKLRVSASESVFIGDNPIADIAGAGQVGMKTIWKRDNPEQESVTADAVADAVIDNLSELLTVLQQLNGAKL
jgi:putative hydrolase of the HAD superfamily